MNISFGLKQKGYVGRSTTLEQVFSGVNLDEANLPDAGAGESKSDDSTGPSAPAVDERVTPSDSGGLPPGFFAEDSVSPLATQGLGWFREPVPEDSPVRSVGNPSMQHDTPPPKPTSAPASPPVPSSGLAPASLPAPSSGPLVAPTTFPSRAQIFDTHHELYVEYGGAKRKLSEAWDFCRKAKEGLVEMRDCLLISRMASHNVISLQTMQLLAFALLDHYDAQLFTQMLTGEINPFIDTPLAYTLRNFTLKNGDSQLKADLSGVSLDHFAKSKYGKITNLAFRGHKVLRDDPELVADTNSDKHMRFVKAIFLGLPVTYFGKINKRKSLEQVSYTKYYGYIYKIVERPSGAGLPPTDTLSWFREDWEEELNDSHKLNRVNAKQIANETEIKNCKYDAYIITSDDYYEVVPLCHAFLMTLAARTEIGTGQPPQSIDMIFKGRKTVSFNVDQSREERIESLDQVHTYGEGGVEDLQKIIKPARARKDVDLKSDVEHLMGTSLFLTLRKALTSIRMVPAVGQPAKVGLGEIWEDVWNFFYSAKNAKNALAVRQLGVSLDISGIIPYNTCKAVELDVDTTNIDKEQFTKHIWRILSFLCWEATKNADAANLLE